MDLKEKWEEFEKTYLYTSDRVKSKYEDRQISKLDIINAFSYFYNSDRVDCVHILKDTQLTSYFWRLIKLKYDLTKLYINYDRLHELLL